MKITGYLGLIACLLGVAPGTIIADDIAWDMVGTTSQGLNSFTVSVPPFSDAQDGFQKYQVGVSASVPYSILDDSAVSFPADSLGIIDSNSNLQEFFGATDTENGENTGPVTATWVFDISSAIGNIVLSVDLGAMGDFEAADSFAWSWQVDGGAVTPAFVGVVDEADSHGYTLAGGSTFTLDDPLKIDGTVVDNNLQTFTTPITSTGSTLTVVLTVETNGGSEAYAAQNLLVTGDVPVELMSFSVE